MVAMTMIVAFLLGLGPIVLALCILGYFLPSMIAFGRGHRQGWSLFVLNLFLGGTGLVWIGCLVWSVWAGQGTTQSIPKVIGTVGASLIAVAITALFVAVVVLRNAQTEMVIMQSGTSAAEPRPTEPADEIDDWPSAPQPASPGGSKAPSDDVHNLGRLIETSTGK